MTERRMYQIWTILLHLTAILTLTLISIHAADGNLIYTLDDPYIHLAVAENILRNGYGVNIQEFSSPSSSIIYPFILSFGIFLGVGQWSPLIIGITASISAIWILSGRIWDWLISPDNEKKFVFVVTPPLLILSVNAVALPLTGMEHPLHVLSCVMIITGLIDMVRKDYVPLVLVFGVLISATIRFEGLALAIATVFAIVWLGHRAYAFTILGIIMLILSIYSIVMYLIGLPVLPSSVLTKSDISAAAVNINFLVAFKKIIVNIFYSFNSRWGVLFTTSILLILFGIFGSPKLDKARQVVAAVSIASLCAHIAFGRYGWFSRYEVYAVMIMLMAILFVHSKSIVSVRVSWVRTALLACGLLMVGAPYALTTFKTPAAARNIYEQQFQMHRFATEFFPYRVAVNDLGWVAYKNDQYVLDLWGLGSEEMRRLTQSNGRSAETIRHLVDLNQIIFAMVYDDWFGDEIPSEWCRIAELRTSQITTASDRVAFYLIDHDRSREMYRALMDFLPSLPSGAFLHLFDCHDT